MQRRIRLGMVGGGQGAFIGAVHRIAARIDDQYELVAGALSSDPQRARDSGAALHLAPERCYSDYRAMAQAESQRADGIEAVAIVTPNHLHAPVATAFMEAGIHVICDKPLGISLVEGQKLAALAQQKNVLFALTHTYSGYPLLRHAKAMVEAGEIGELRLVQVEYSQDWLADAIAAGGMNEGNWHNDPHKAGPGGTLLDVGLHAYHLAQFVSGLTPHAVLAELSTFVPNRTLDDHVQVMLRYANGAKGTLWASQVATGCENALRLRVYGEAGGLEWAQEDPNYLWYTPFGEPKRLLTRGGVGAGPEAARVSRTPGGHPEGYLEGFANIYAEAARAILARRTGAPVPEDVTYPTIEDGVKGVAFVEACVRSSARNSAWVKP